MKKTVGIIVILALPLLVLFLALVLAISNTSKGANYPKHALEKAVTHDKKDPHPKKIKPSIIK
ncbi:hypothetical protein [uncultured Campylobacter sp.]|uniref:hypothetical protein n=1 Tax=uncultured Campylobacter sp. TaxID=218934 RepID=UPI00263835DB|nr:hypothetical protein [uncultured Campylobacter sp.]